LHEARKRLEEIGSPAFTICDVRSHGLQTGIRGTWRGEPYVRQVVHKIKVEVLCDHGQVDQVAKTLAEASRTGQPGDGVVFVSPVDRIWEIRTGQEGFGAVYSH
jgi:nitrogen regulatory protein PII